MGQDSSLFKRYCDGCKKSQAIDQVQWYTCQACRSVCCQTCVSDTKSKCADCGMFVGTKTCPSDYCRDNPSMAAVHLVLSKQFPRTQITAVVGKTLVEKTVCKRCLDKTYHKVTCGHYVSSTTSVWECDKCKAPTCVVCPQHRVECPTCETEAAVCDRCVTVSNRVFEVSNFIIEKGKDDNGGALVRVKCTSLGCQQSAVCAKCGAAYLPREVKHCVGPSKHPDSCPTWLCADCGPRCDKCRWANGDIKYNCCPSEWVVSNVTTDPRCVLCGSRHASTEHVLSCANCHGPHRIRLCCSHASTKISLRQLTMRESCDACGLWLCRDCRISRCASCLLFFCERCLTAGRDTQHLWSICSTCVDGERDELSTRLHPTLPVVAIVKSYLRCEKPVFH